MSTEQRRFPESFYLSYRYYDSDADSEESCAVNTVGDVEVVYLEDADFEVDGVQYSISRRNYHGSRFYNYRSATSGGTSMQVFFKCPDCGKDWESDAEAWLKLALITCICRRNHHKDSLRDYDLSYRHDRFHVRDAATV